MRPRVVLLAFAALAGALALLTALIRGPAPDVAAGASHREAPAISLDQTADISDFYFFRSYESGAEEGRPDRGRDPGRGA